MRLKNNHSKKSRSFFSIVYETYKEFAENTSVHGLKYTVKNEIGILEKLFWSVVLLAGLSTSIYLTVLFWQRYVSNPTRTTILSYYAPTLSIPFPAITMCNINRIMDSKIDDFIKTLKIKNKDILAVRKAIPQMLSITDPNGIEYNKTELTLLQTILEANNIFNMSLLMKKVTQNCSEMLQYCAWQNSPVNCSKLFKESLTADGYCCSFNYGSTEKKYDYTVYNGLGTGLLVILDPMLQPIQYSSLQSSGFKIIIHDPEEYPGSESTTKMISIGRASYLQLYGTKMRCSEAVANLPITQRNCFYEDEKQLKAFDGYSESNCVTECEAYYIYNKCDCVPYFYKFIGKPQCNISKISCILDIRKGDVDSTEICDCPAQCEDDYYNVISAHTTFDYDERYTMQKYGNTTIKPKETILLNIFFNEQTQTIYLRDTIFSTVYLLSSFGGVYSLFMGCSLITAVEIIYYCMIRFFVNMKLVDKVEAEPEINEKNRRNLPTLYSDNIKIYNFYNSSTFLP